MNELDRDRTSRRFADLTVLLEDAATLAVEGQSVKQPLVSAKANIKQIWPLLNDCHVTLAAIERDLDEVPCNQER